ncbi:MAG TPA: leucine dehydrogenase, partial [Flavobacteriaceae bacterium]|nr:leucine dehydrogenase [Flavobacteriaceae bacterium]
MDAEILNPNELKKTAPVFGQISYDNHEQVVFCHDKGTGLKAIIGIHNT